MEKKNTFFVYGLIVAIIMIVCNVALYISGIMFKPELKWISYLASAPFLVGIIMNAISFSNSKDNFVTFGNVFGNCFKVVLVVTAIMLIWTPINSLIFPEMKDRIIDMQREQMIKQQLPDDKIDVAINMTRKFWTVGMYIGVIIIDIVVGAVYSLIGAAIAKKKGEPPITASNF